MSRNNAGLPSPDLTPYIGGDAFKVEGSLTSLSPNKPGVNMDASPPHPKSGGRSRALQRTPQACDRCKARKLKCDSSSDKCMNCRTADVPCYQTNKITKQRHTRGFWEDLQGANLQLQKDNERLRGQVDHSLCEKLQLLKRIRQLEHQIGVIARSMDPTSVPATSSTNCVPIPDWSADIEQRPKEMTEHMFPGQPDGLQQSEIYSLTTTPPSYIYPTAPNQGHLPQYWHSGSAGGPFF